MIFICRLQRYLRLTAAQEQTGWTTLDVFSFYILHEEDLELQHGPQMIKGIMMNVCS